MLLSEATLTRVRRPFRTAVHSLCHRSYWRFCCDPQSVLYRPFGDTPGLVTSLVPHSPARFLSSSRNGEDRNHSGIHADRAAYSGVGGASESGQAWRSNPVSLARGSALPCLLRIAAHGSCRARSLACHRQRRWLARLVHHQFRILLRRSAHPGNRTSASRDTSCTRAVPNYVRTVVLQPGVRDRGRRPGVRIRRGRLIGVGSATRRCDHRNSEHGTRPTQGGDDIAVPKAGDVSAAGRRAGKSRSMRCHGHSHLSQAAHCALPPAGDPRT